MYVTGAIADYGSWRKTCLIIVSVCVCERECTLCVAPVNKRNTRLLVVCLVYDAWVRETYVSSLGVSVMCACNVRQSDMTCVVIACV